MARTTSPTKRDTSATDRRRPSRSRGRAVQAAVIIGILAFAGARAVAAPVGPIDVSAHPSAASASVPGADVSWGIDAQGRVGSVTVHRSAAEAGADQAVTVEVSDEAGVALATVTTVLHGPDAVVALPAPVDPARVARVALRG
jgi:hypothetical protein